MSLSLSPFVIVQSAAEAQTLVELATRLGVTVNHQYTNPNGLGQRIGGWYWYAHGTGSKDNSIYFYGDSVASMINALTCAKKTPISTNSIPHFIAMCRRLAVECAVTA